VRLRRSSGCDSDSRFLQTAEIALAAELFAQCLIVPVSASSSLSSVSLLGGEGSGARRKDDFSPQRYSAGDFGHPYRDICSAEPGRMLRRLINDDQLGAYFVPARAFRTTVLVWTAHQYQLASSARR
jgi:hypothetical protein